LDKIDGDLTKDVWEDVPWSEPFGDIQGSDSANAQKHVPAVTQFRALYDDTHLYISAILDPSPDFNTQAHFTERNEPIFQKDSDFEVFIDVWNQNHQYKELEVNAINTVWNLLLDRPYSDGGSEHSGRIAQPGQDQFYEVYHQKTAARVLEGKVNDDQTGNGAKWCVEMALAYQDLFATTSQLESTTNPTQLPKILPGTIWRINFSRVELQGEVNWTWQPQVVWDPQSHLHEGKINMHLPDAWGYLVFKDKSDKEKLVRDPFWPLRLTCMNVYYAQAHFYELNGCYAISMESLMPFVDPHIVKPFEIEITSPANGNMDPKNTSPSSYTATVREMKGAGTKVATICHDRLLKVSDSSGYTTSMVKD